MRPAKQQPTERNATRKKQWVPPAELREFIDALAGLLADDFLRRANEKKNVGETNKKGGEKE